MTLRTCSRSFNGAWFGLRSDGARRMRTSFPQYMAPLEGGGNGTLHPGGTTEQVLAVHMSLQEETNWCWAAVTQAVLRFSKKIDISQEAIASNHSRLTGKSYDCSQRHRRKQTLRKKCGDANCLGACNDAHILRIILAEHGSFDRTLTSNAAPTFDHIRTEIAAKRPLPCRVQWRPRGGHFVLITGWQYGVDDVERVRVLDPAWNEGGSSVIERTIAYDDLAHRYRGTLGNGFINFSYRIS